MRVPNGFKQTEVGLIPKDWKVVELEQVVDFLDDKRKPVNSSDRGKIKGIYPYYGASGIIDYVNDYIFNDELILLGEDGENILSRNLRLAFIARGKMWVNNHAHALKAKDGFNAEFIAEKLESLNYEQYNSGTAQPKLTKGTCAKIKISIPATLSEQTAIADALSDMDALIKSVEKLLEKKRLVKQGAMQELLRPKEDWKQYSFDDAFVKVPIKLYQITTDKYKKFGELPIIDQGQEQIVGYSDLCHKVFKAPRDGVIVFGDHTRIIKFITFDFIVGADGVQLLIAKEGNIAKFLYQYLKAHEVPSTGYNRHFKYIKEALYYFPDEFEQKRIAQILSAMDAEIEQLEIQLAKYRQLKTGMMQELLTGKKRLA